jgi:hypothetical protein
MSLDSSLGGQYMSTTSFPTVSSQYFSKGHKLNGGIASSFWPSRSARSRASSSLRHTFSPGRHNEVGASNIMKSSQSPAKAGGIRTPADLVAKTSLDVEPVGGPVNLKRGIPSHSVYTVPGPRVCIVS